MLNPRAPREAASALGCRGGCARGAHERGGPHYSEVGVSPIELLPCCAASTIRTRERGDAAAPREANPPPTRMPHAAGGASRPNDVDVVGVPSLVPDTGSDIAGTTLFPHDVCSHESARHGST